MINSAYQRIKCEVGFCGSFLTKVFMMGDYELFIMLQVVLITVKHNGEISVVTCHSPENRF